MMSQKEIEEFLYKYKSTNMIFVNDKDEMKYNRILLENIDLKNRLDKIKEYTNTLLFELNRGKEFEKWEEILNPILYLLEEIDV